MWIFDTVHPSEVRGIFEVVEGGFMGFFLFAVGAWLLCMLVQGCSFDRGYRSEQDQALAVKFAHKRK